MRSTYRMYDLLNQKMYTVSCMFLSQAVEDIQSRLGCKIEILDQRHGTINFKKILS